MQVISNGVPHPCTTIITVYFSMYLLHRTCNIKSLVCIFGKMLRRRLLQIRYDFLASKQSEEFPRKWISFSRDSRSSQFNPRAISATNICPHSLDFPPSRFQCRPLVGTCRSRCSSHRIRLLWNLPRYGTTWKFRTSLLRKRSLLWELCKSNGGYSRQLSRVSCKHHHGRGHHASWV